MNPARYPLTHEEAIRFVKRITPGPRWNGSTCYIWTGTLDRKGYGKGWRRRPVQRFAHRIAYEAVVARIPPGMQIDHLCRQRACVNPKHMQAVTSLTNALRGYGPVGLNSRKERCIRGHLFTEENIERVRSKPHWRHCKTCKNSAKRAKYDSAARSDRYRNGGG